MVRGPCSAEVETPTLRLGHQSEGAILLEEAAPLEPPAPLEPGAPPRPDRLGGRPFRRGNSGRGKVC